MLDQIGHVPRAIHSPHSGCDPALFCASASLLFMVSILSLRQLPSAMAAETANPKTVVSISFPHIFLPSLACNKKFLIKYFSLTVGCLDPACRLLLAQANQRLSGQSQRRSARCLQAVKGNLHSHIVNNVLKVVRKGH